MPERPEVVAYLQANLKKFPLEDLRRQLAREGVSDAEFEEALGAAKKSPPRKPAKRAGLLFLAAGVALIAIAAFIALGRKPPPETPQNPSSPAGGEGAFVGRYGYVIHLPKDYSAVSSFKDPEKTIEVVHFCKAGTDPTNFADEGLFGPLGIVRLEVQPSTFADSVAGLAALTKTVTARLRSRGEKFTLKNVQVSSLRGVQINYDVPFPRVEAYVLGQRALYLFMAGQDDEIYRDVLMSLRETSSEN